MMPPIVPVETVLPAMPEAPRVPLPSDSCDAHTHVFGPYEQFPLTFAPSYSPPLAPFESHARMLSRVGVDRAVLVQPTPYGVDNRALADALGRGRGRLRGVAAATRATADAELDALDAAGVRGLRFNEVVDSATGRRFEGSVALDELDHLAPRMRARGWHAQIWATSTDVPRIVRAYGRLGVPLVFEHLAGFSVTRGVPEAAVREVAALMSAGEIWVKASVCRVSTMGPDFSDVAWIHDALVSANATRVVWASDWPFVRMGERAPDVGHLVDLVSDWITDAEVRRQVFADNAAALYGYPR